MSGCATTIVPHPMTPAFCKSKSDSEHVVPRRQFQCNKQCSFDARERVPGERQVPWTHGIRLAMKMLWRIVVAVLLLTALATAWLQLPVADWVTLFRGWMLDQGAVGIGAFVLLYIVVTVLLGPASALTLSAGLAYGAWGFPLVVVSATLAACAAFLLGRHVASEHVNRWLVRDARLYALHTAINAEGWRLVALMRLSPLIPYGMQNYLFSVTQISFTSFTFATLVGIMPATALYIYIGSLGQTLVSSGGPTDVLQWILLIAGLIVTIIIAWVVGRRARAALAGSVEDVQR